MQGGRCGAICKRWSESAVWDFLSGGVAPAPQLEAVSSPFLSTNCSICGLILMNKTTRKKLIINIRYVAIVIGCLVGILAYKLVSDGYLTKWEHIPSAPSAPYTLEAKPYQPLQVIADDGRRYELTANGWIEGDQPEPLLDGFPAATPCGLSGPKFAFTTSPPRYIRKCIEMTYPMHESSIQVAYVIDGDGELFKWDHTDYAFTSIARCILFPPLGALIAFPLTYVFQRITRHLSRAGELTSRWRRPGMRRDLLAMERECGAGIPGRWGSPGASARGCYAASLRIQQRVA